MLLENIAAMTVKDFNKMRSDKKFTAKAIEKYLNEYTKYSCKVVDTLYSGKGNKRWNRIKFWNKVKADAPQIPEYFAYIKFYTEAGINDDEIYALVAGKTKFYSSEIHFGKMKDDGVFLDYVRKDKAKKWLCGAKERNGNRQEDSRRWCYEKIMIIWDPEASKDCSTSKHLENLAYSIEADIGGLFGLFSS